MRFIDTTECRAWARVQNISLSDKRGPLSASEVGLPTLRVGFPSQSYRTTWFARYLIDVLSGPSELLLWVLECGIWPNSENWLLYQRLRQGYGNQGSIDQTPGHLFSATEHEDLATFLQVGILFGWDMCVLVASDRARLFISHDEFVDLASADPLLLGRCCRELREANIPVLNDRSA